MPPALRRLHVVAAVLLAVVLGAPPAMAADGGGPTAPRPGHPLLGTALTWSDDTAADYAERLGEAPALFVWESSYPLTQQLRMDLRGALEQAASQGSGLMVVLTPGDLDAALDPDLPDEVVVDLDAAGAGGEVPVWLDLFPDLNAPWRVWGQRPSDVVPAYQAVAAAVHASLPNTAMAATRSPTRPGHLRWTRAHPSTTRPTPTRWTRALRWPRVRATSSARRRPGRSSRGSRS